MDSNCIRQLTLDVNGDLSEAECTILGVKKLTGDKFNIDTIEKLHIFVVKKIYDETCFEYFVNIIKLLTEYKAKIYVEGVVFEEFKEKNMEAFAEENKLIKLDHEKHEMIIGSIITIGGDGTILWALQYFQKRLAPPVLTFDRGTLGYMCNFAMNKYEATIRKYFDSIISKEPIFIETKFRIACEIRKKGEPPQKFVAINEFLVDRGPSPLVCKIDCFIEENYLTTFEGDGVIISTPNGSTAYQLSAGGPILHQLVPSVAITPICPLSLATRPVILPMDLSLTLKINKDSRNNAWFAFDGIHRVEIFKEDSIFITKTDFHVPFLADGCKETLDSWLLRLRHLLGWNSKKSLDFPTSPKRYK